MLLHLLHPVNPSVDRRRLLPYKNIGRTQAFRLKGFRLKSKSLTAFSLSTYVFTYLIEIHVHL